MDFEQNGGNTGKVKPVASSVSRWKRQKFHVEHVTVLHRKLLKFEKFWKIIENFNYKFIGKNFKISYLAAKFR